MSRDQATRRRNGKHKTLETNKLETLSVSMFLRTFLIFDDFEPRDSRKKDPYKKETVFVNMLMV